MSCAQGCSGQCSPGSGVMFFFLFVWHTCMCACTGAHPLPLGEMVSVAAQLGPVPLPVTRMRGLTRVRHAAAVRCSCPLIPQKHAREEAPLSPERSVPCRHCAPPALRSAATSLHTSLHT